MEEKKLPWWRKALSFALDGIRSGFGLFSRSAKHDSQDEPESPSAQQETPDETELTSRALELEPVAAVANEAELAAVAVAANDQPPPEQTAPEHSEKEQSELEEIEAQTSEPAGDGGSTRRTEPSQAEETSAPEEVALSPALSIQSAPEDEMGHAPKEELEPEPEASIEPEPLTAPHESPLIAATTSADVEEEPVEEIGALSETSTESETPLEALADKEETLAAVAEETEPKEPIGVPEPAVLEAESAHEPVPPEPVIIEEPVSAPDSIPEPSVSSVELGEPVSEEVAPQPIGQADAVEEESVEELSPVPETNPDSEQVAEPVPESVIESVPEPAAEEVAEEIPEPVIEPMKSNEPIPEQPADPAEAGETVPVAPEVVSEAVPNEEALEAAAESAISPEESRSENSVPEEAEVDPSEADQGAVPQPELEPVTAVASSDPTPEAEIVPSNAVEATPEPVAITAPTPEPPATAAPPHKPFIKLESRDNEADLSPFSVVVSQVYDGPLDLLLDLIRKQDIDIYDIPIARITAQFLAYVNQLKATDVDVAGEFIYTASLLIHIKSKMLLPRAPSGQDDAAEDPRRELVERLLEHERFKNAAQMLQQKQMLEAATWTNPGLREFQDDTSAEPEIAADTVDLVRIFRDILERARNRPVINVEEDSVTVGQMIQFLARRLTMEDKPVALRRLLSHTRSERALIAMFLALLELVRLQAILLRQDLAFSEIFIKKHTGFEAVMNEGATSARDDWR